MDILPRTHRHTLHDHSNNYNYGNGKDNFNNDNNNDNGSVRVKWVINLSSTAVMAAQKSLLPRGPNFTIVPKCSPKGEYVAAMEEACYKLPPVSREAQGRKRVLKHAHP